MKMKETLAMGGTFWWSKERKDARQSPTVAYSVLRIAYCVLRIGYCVVPELVEGLRIALFLSLSKDCVLYQRGIHLRRDNIGP